MKCLHGETKSSNKSFNEMIWAKIAKLHYVGNLKSVFMMLLLY